MKFSLIVPVYNVEKYLNECIESLLEQTNKDYEIILIDDGSTDESGEICNKYSEKFQNIYVFHQKNKGLSAARNEGVKHAKGQYIWFIDSDDLILTKNALELLASVANDYPEVITFGWKQSADSKEFKKCDAIYNFTSDELRDGKKFLFSELNDVKPYFWYAWVYLYRRDYWVAHGFEFPEGKKFEDIRVTYRTILEAKSIKPLQKALYGYRIQRKGSITSTGDFCTLQDGIEAVAQNINDILRNNDIADGLKKKLANNFACSYFGMMILSTKLPADERRKFRATLKCNFWIAKHITSKKQRVATIAISILGVTIVQKILGVRRILKYGK